MDCRELLYIHSWSLEEIAFGDFSSCTTTRFTFVVSSQMSRQLLDELCEIPVPHEMNSDNLGDP